MEKIISSLLAGDVTTSSNELTLLNLTLTGIAGGDFQSDTDSMAILEKKIGSFIEQVKQKKEASLVLYLGDGGYSRLLLIAEDDIINIAISPVSTSSVMKKWKKLLGC